MADCVVFEVPGGDLGNCWLDGGRGLVSVDATEPAAPAGAQRQRDHPAGLQPSTLPQRSPSGATAAAADNARGQRFHPPCCRSQRAGTGHTARAGPRLLTKKDGFHTKMMDCVLKRMDFSADPDRSRWKSHISHIGPQPCSYNQRARLDCVFQTQWPLCRYVSANK